MNGALEGIRIVDLTANVTGPYATMMLADQGAHVIKIEQPPYGDVMRFLGSHRGGITSLFASCNRSKRSVVFNLKEDEGREIVRELARKADVFVQNFRPGVIDRLGLGESDLRREHPELIYVSMNAFGEQGPYAKQPAYDHILQGMTGAAYVQADPPQYMRQAWCDKATGVTAAQAITAALFARERGAGGQHIRLSMLDASISFLWPDGHTDTMLMEEEGTVRVPPISGTYIPVETKDGFATIAAVTPEQRDRLLAVLERVDLLVDPRFATLDAFMENLEAFRAEVLSSQKGRTTAELVEALREADVPCGPVLRIEEVPDFPQVVANQTLVTSEHPQMGRIREPRPAARFEGTPSAIRNPAPTLGQHSDEVLRELGHGDQDIARLRSEGVVS